MKFLLFFFFQNRIILLSKGIPIKCNKTAKQFNVKLRYIIQFHLLRKAESHLASNKTSLELTIPLSLSLSIFSIFEYLTFLNEPPPPPLFRKLAPAFNLQCLRHRITREHPTFPLTVVPGFESVQLEFCPRKVGFTCRNAESRQQFHEKRFLLSLSPSFSLLRRCDSKEGPRIRRWHYNHRFGRVRGRGEAHREDHFRGDNQAASRAGRAGCTMKNNEEIIGRGGCVVCAMLECEFGRA